MENMLPLLVNTPHWETERVLIFQTLSGLGVSEPQDRCALTPHPTSGRKMGLKINRRDLLVAGGLFLVRGKRSSAQSTAPPRVLT